MILFFNLGSGFVEYGCVESVSIQRNTERIETSTLSTGTDKTWDYQSKDYSISVSGLVLNDDPKITVWQMWAVQDNFLKVPYKFVATDPDATVKAIIGVVMVDSINIEGSEEDLASSTIQLQGSGGVVVLDTADEVELSLEVTSTPGGAAQMGNVILTDALGNETNVFVGPLTEGNSTTVSIIPGTYHIRATLTTDQDFNLYESDAIPGFAQQMPGPFTNQVYWPLPADFPIWDFTANRYLKFHASDVPIS